MKKQNILLITTLLLIVSLFACNENKVVETNQKTLIIGHRSTGAGVNDGFVENTLPAIREALKYADGIEADVQMSSSKTIWIYHDDLYSHLCDSSKLLLKSRGYTCVLQTPDSIIEQLRICRDGVEERIYKLEDLFVELSKNKGKIVSLDIKGYFDSTCVKINNVSKTYLYDLADEIYALVEKYDVKDQIIAETSYTEVFERLKEKDKTIKCHYLVFNHLDEKIDYAIEKKADGLTINMHDESFNAEQMEKAKSKGLKVQLWTIRNEDDLNRALKLKPFAIQVSSLELLRKSAEIRSLQE